MRLTAIAAGLVLLGSAACTSATSGQGNAGPVASSAAPTTSAAATTPAATATPTPTLPAPPEPADVPVDAIPVCKTATTCKANTVIGNVHPGVHFVVVRGPDPDEVTQSAYAMTLDAGGTVLAQAKLTHGDYFFDPGLTAPTCDALAHCFVSAGMGTHAGTLNVLSVSDDGVLTDLDPGDTFSTDTPTMRGADLDGDGVDEVVGTVNDYIPDYATGTNFWTVWKWQGTKFAAEGCRKVKSGETLPSGPLSPANCPSS